MSIALVSANPDYLQGTAPSVTYPFAMALWFKPGALNLDMVLASLADPSVEDNFHALLFKGTLGTNLIHALSDDAAAISASGLSSLVWYHILGVWESASSRKVYLDGTNEGVDATNKTIAGINQLTVGRLGKLTPTNPTQGSVSDVAVWDLTTIFTPEERIQLGIFGASPLLMRADQLVSYSPAPGVTPDPVVDVVGGFHLTQFGFPTTDNDGPPIVPPVPGQVEPPAITAISATIVQNIPFGQAALNNIKQGAGASSLAFTQEALNNIRVGVVTHTLAFSDDEVVNNIKQGSGSNSIAFGQAESNNVIFDSASNGLVFGNLPIITNLKIISIGNNFFFAGFAGRHIDISIGNALLFLDDAFTNVKFASAQSTFVVGSTPLSQGSEYNVSILQQFLFEQAVRRTIDGVASNTITFGQEAARRLDGLSQLLFGGFVTVDKCKHLINEILFGQSVSVSHDRSFALGHACTWAGVVIGVIDDNCKLYEYTPNGALPTIVLGIRQGVRLESGAFNIELRNPEFGNGDEVDPKRILRRSRGGTVQLVRDPIWPNKTTLTMNFIGLTRVKAQEFVTFLENSLGQLTTFTDQENQIWDGVILNPYAGISDLQGDRDCNYGTDLVFIGERT